MVWFTVLVLLAGAAFWWMNFKSPNAEGLGKVQGTFPEREPGFSVSQFNQLLTALARIEEKVNRIEARNAGQILSPSQQTETDALRVEIPEASLASAVEPEIAISLKSDATPDFKIEEPTKIQSEVEYDALAELQPTFKSAAQPEVEFKNTRPQWAEDASLILKKIGSWILVGEEHRPKGMSFEFAVASTWLMRLGIIVLVACVAWFLKWSMDHGILGPSGRVGLSFMAGAALLVTGYWQMGKHYQVIGQGLMGGGLAALYFAGYAAGPLYDLIPILACFAVMALVTLTGCVLAAVTQSQVTAVLAMLGGYCTPVILSTGHPNFLGLYAYMTLLGTGILGLAIARNWRILHYLAFFAHWALVLGSLKDYESSVQFATVLPFVILFFLQQHGVILGYALRRAQSISLLEALHQLGHTVLFTALAYGLIDETIGRPWTAILAMGLSALFIAQTALLLKRMPFDRLSLSVSLALSGFFLAWSIPLLFSGSTLVVAWSLMAIAWLWIGLRMESKLLIIGSQLLLVLAAIRLSAFDLPTNFHASHWNSTAPDRIAFGEYLLDLSQRLLNFGVFLGCLFTASWMYRRNEKAALSNSKVRLSTEADLPIELPFGLAGQIVFYAGLGFAFVLANLEGSRLLSFYSPLSWPGMLLIWLAFAFYLVRRSARTGGHTMMWVATTAMAWVVLRMVVYDWPKHGCYPWHLSFHTLGAHFLFRTLAHVAVIGLIALLSQGRFGMERKTPLAKGYAIVALVLTFLWLTIETQTVTGILLPAIRAGAVSVVWVLFAMGLVAFGLKLGERALRIAGLALFAIVAGKVFLLDLSRLEMIWRVLSFMAVGGVLLLGSFAYLRASRPETESLPSAETPKEEQ